MELNPTLVQHAPHLNKSSLHANQNPKWLMLTTTYWELHIVQVAPTELIPISNKLFERLPEAP